MAQFQKGNQIGVKNRPPTRGPYPKSRVKRQKRQELALKEAKARITKAIWEQFLRYLVSGYSVSEAREAAKIPDAAYRVLLLSDEEKREQRDLAVSEYIRTVWTDEIMDEIFTDIAEGGIAKHIIPGYAPVELENPTKGFYNLLYADEVLMDKYRAAREMAMWGMADEIIEISDDESNDTLETTDNNGNKKIISNPSAVRRSEAKVRARQWLMERLHNKTFGNKVQNEHKIQIVDHASMLDGARRRKADAAKQREKLVKGKTLNETPKHLKQEEPGE